MCIRDRWYQRRVHGELNANNFFREFKKQGKQALELLLGGAPSELSVLLGEFYRRGGEFSDSGDFLEQFKRFIVRHLLVSRRNLKVLRPSVLKSKEFGRSLELLEAMLSKNSGFSATGPEYAELQEHFTGLISEWLTTPRKGREGRQEQMMLTPFGETSDYFLIDRLVMIGALTNLGEILRKVVFTAEDEVLQSSELFQQKRPKEAMADKSKESGDSVVFTSGSSAQNVARSDNFAFNRPKETPQVGGFNYFKRNTEQPSEPLPPVPGAKGRTNLIREEEKTQHEEKKAEEPLIQLKQVEPPPKKSVAFSVEEPKKKKDPPPIKSDVQMNRAEVPHRTDPRPATPNFGAEDDLGELRRQIERLESENTYLLTTVSNLQSTKPQVSSKPRPSPQQSVDQLQTHIDSLWDSLAETTQAHRSFALSNIDRRSARFL
eukprot:TRINITY_DN8381_c0_g1_i1.p1 TRINITY_DN8381_c0_g1~~TRINITY_DN8381_c0_g1_i1.p1  ORF type:complete len:433 (-),score=88.06 TRINITY_DN8381_c0_g1_i1:130-1428(-)